jgi:hypothetical protein
LTSDASRDADPPPSDAPIPTADAGPPPACATWPTGRYQTYTASLTWLEAEAACEAEDAHLASYGTEAEWNAAAPIATAPEGNWIGLFVGNAGWADNPTGCLNEYCWIDGTSVGYVHPLNPFLNTGPCYRYDGTWWQSLSCDFRPSGYICECG